MKMRGNPGAALIDASPILLPQCALGHRETLLSRSSHALVIIILVKPRSLSDEDRQHIILKVLLLDKKYFDV